MDLGSGLVDGVKEGICGFDGGIWSICQRNYGL